MSDAKGDKFERTLAALLRPIARLIIANELPLARVVEVLKRILVAAAETGHAKTDSHISLKTGVHRKDVKRLRSGSSPSQVPQATATPIASVLTSWTKRPEFLDTNGQPRPLSRRKTMTGPGFDDLVRATKIDVPPATVLSELLSQGIVSKDENDLLVIMSDTYVPKLGDAVLDALQATLVDHLNVSVENALATTPGPKAFDRTLRYSHLSQASVDQLEAASRDAALEYLNMLNALAHTYQLADETEDGPTTGRFVTGVFIAPTVAIKPIPEKDEKNK